MVEKLVTLARNAKKAAQEAGIDDLRSDAERGSDAWREYRKSDKWREFKKVEAPYGTAYRKAFSILRDKEAVDILFNELADKYSDRDGGYTRIVRLAERRLGDAGEQAFIEFVGENDRERVEASAPAPVVVDDEPAAEEPAAEEDDSTEEEAVAEESESAEDEASEEAEKE